MTTTETTHKFETKRPSRIKFKCPRIETSRIHSIVFLISEYLVQRGQKLVRKCTLIGAKHVLVDERIYCINRNGNMNQTRAMQYCKDINATLPLPVSLLEFETFSNFSGPDKAWIGISDPSNSGKKENWRDGHNKKPAYVKPRVKTLDDFLKFHTEI